MPVRLNITPDETLYRRLKEHCPPKGISRFIADAVRAQLDPSPAALESGYRAAARETWRAEFAEAWEISEIEDWPA